MWGTLYGGLILNGTYEYTFVVTRRPRDKESIDAYLRANGGEHLIV